MAQDATQQRQPVNLGRVRHNARQVEPLFRYAKEYRVTRLDVDRDKARAGAQLLGEDVWAMVDEIEHLRAAAEALRETHGSASYLAGNLAATQTERDEFEAERDKALAEVESLRRELRNASVLLAAIVLGQKGGRLTVPDISLQVADPDCLVRRDMPGPFGGVDLRYQPGRVAAETNHAKDTTTDE